MPIVKGRDPLDADPESGSVRLGAKLRETYEALADRKDISLNQAMNQVLKWGLENAGKLPIKDPLDVDPDSVSLRLGGPLKRKLEELGRAKGGWSYSEVVTEILKLGIREGFK